VFLYKSNRVFSGGSAPFPGRLSLAKKRRKNCGEKSATNHCKTRPKIENLQKTSQNLMKATRGPYPPLRFYAENHSNLRWFRFSHRFEESCKSSKNVAKHMLSVSSLLCEQFCSSVFCEKTCTFLYNFAVPLWCSRAVLCAGAVASRLFFFESLPEVHFAAPARRNMDILGLPTRECGAGAVRSTSCIRLLLALEGYFGR
jgi:hypothetical protein